MSLLGNTDASTGPILLLKVEIRLNRFADAIVLFVRCASCDAAGDAKDERVPRALHSLSHDGAGTDSRSGAAVRSVQQHRSHRDQHVVFDGRTVDDGAVPDAD